LRRAPVPRRAEQARPFHPDSPQVCWSAAGPPQSLWGRPCACQSYTRPNYPVFTRHTGVATEDGMPRTASLMTAGQHACSIDRGSAPPSSSSSDRPAPSSPPFSTSSPTPGTWHCTTSVPRSTTLTAHCSIARGRHADNAHSAMTPMQGGPHPAAGACAHGGCAARHQPRRCLPRRRRSTLTLPPPGLYPPRRMP